MFWLYEWLDDRGIARGIDLSGDLDCFAWKCRKAQVDKLLSRAWHYFDSVVVVGPSAHRVAGDLENGVSETSLARLTSDMQLLLYLREVGAEPLVIFRQKPPPCEIHVDQHAREVGLDQALDRLDALAERAVQEAEIKTEKHEDHLHYEFVHPRFEHTVWGTAWPEGEDLQLEVSRAVFRRYMSHLTSDVPALDLDCHAGSQRQERKRIGMAQTVARGLGGFA